MEFCHPIKDNPKSSNVVMIATVIVVVATHNLALGVLTGVLFRFVLGQ
jgi:SulP family sulfate permease